MKLVADDKIPYLDLFSAYCDEIILLPGEKITRADLHNTDLLITRTVTDVNESLLKNTPVKFVGTATTGLDHIDDFFLKKNNIFFADAAGANSKAVAEYSMCCIAALIHTKKLKEKGTAGVIGYGRIGKQVAHLLKTLGFTVFLYDPFLEDIQSTPLETLLAKSDLITLHTPLTKTGLYPTQHLIDEKELHLMKKNAVLMNTARGGVINQTALLHNNHLTLCLDVFDNEPHISLELLHKTTIATPHIAGYSTQAKARATQMLFDHAADFFGWAKKNSVSSLNEKLLPDTISLEKCLLQYDPIVHTQSFCAAFEGKSDVASVFREERKRAGFREEFL